MSEAQRNENRPSDQEVRATLREITGFDDKEIDEVISTFRRELDADYIDLCRSLTNEFLHDPHVKSVAARIEAHIGTTLKMQKEIN